MEHARVALYEIRSGSFDDIATRAERDLLALFRQQPGFRSYGLVRVEHTRLMSISLWATEAQAHTAAEIAGEWVDENMADEVKLLATYIGELSFWSSVAPSEFSGMQTPIPT
jgi:heme-degrading monooxygenase HmoA